MGSPCYIGVVGVGKQYRPPTDGAAYTSILQRGDIAVRSIGAEGYSFSVKAGTKGEEIVPK